MQTFSSDDFRDLISQRGKRVMYLEEATSTNDLALKWIDQGAESGCAIVADVQTAGRGRLGRHWHAPSGSALLMTYIVQVPTQFATRSVMLGSLAVAEMLSLYSDHTVSIKYPNDVQVNGRKIAGVLAETAWKPNQPDHISVALGIGLNLCVPLAGTPFEYTAINLAEISKQPNVDRMEVLYTLLNALDIFAHGIAMPEFVLAWRGKLNMLGERVRVTLAPDQPPVEGVALNVNDDGSLRLRLDNGVLRDVIAGDLLVIKDE
jgi:BirA family transcriptional regulator, biotin operon repressor / biotin---[acetyl-CoA-carboxylase] ligase